MPIRRWYVDASGAKVDLASVVADGVATVELHEIILPDGARWPFQTLVARPGSHVGELTQDPDPVPTSRPAPSPVAGSDGGGTIAAVGAQPPPTDQLTVGTRWVDTSGNLEG